MADINKTNDMMIQAMEMLMNNNDPNASDNEKIDVDTARAIAALGKVSIESFKVKAQVLNSISRAENPQSTRQALADAGFLENKKQLE